MTELSLVSYFITSNRNRATILNYISEFKSYKLVTKEYFMNDELMVVPIDYKGNHDQIDDYDWIPVNNLEDIINLGLSKPARCFSLNLNIQTEIIDCLILSFTLDGNLILGFSFPDSSSIIESVKNILLELMNKYDGIAGAIFSELPPPLTKKQFLSELKESNPIFII